MPTPITLPGFEGRSLTIESNIWSGQPKLMLDGVQVQPTSQTGTSFDSPPISAPGYKSPKGQRNEFLLRQNDGGEVLVRVKPSFPDPAPVLEVNGQIIRTARPLNAFEWIWAGLPLALIVLGGAIGGALGAVAAVVNINLIRDDSKGLLRYVMCAVVTSFTFSAFLILMILLRGATQR